MGKYWILQSKRLLRLLGAAAAVLAVMAVCLGLGGQALVRSQADDETRQRFPIGLVGVPEGGMLRMGLTALESFDDLGLAVELVELSPEQAPAALESGRVKAYAVIPEGFAREASHGRLLTIKYVTTPDPSGMGALFQQEITDIVGDVLLQSEKASFGTYDALAPHIGHDGANRATNDLSLELAEYIFIRNRASVTVALGIGSAPSLPVYLGCGLSVSGMLLLGLCFAPLIAGQDPAVTHMLKARGRSVLGLQLVDLAIVALGLWLLGAGLFAAVRWMLPQLPWASLWGLMGVGLTVCALAYLCFSLTSQLHSAMLIYFFLSLALALAGGCLYPVWFLPEPMQRLAAWLPTALARRVLTGTVTGNFSPEALGGCLGWAFVMSSLGVLARLFRLRKETSL